MKAMVNRIYGPPDVIKLEQIPMPDPGDEEVLIKVDAASVNAADWHFLRADPFPIRLVSGLFKPKETILGSDIAGRVEAVGKKVNQFQPGDEVFGDISACGKGGFADYVSAHENALVLKPANLTFEQAAAVPMAGVTALGGLRHKGRILPGKKVLIHGASGGVGTFAVQIAKAMDAEVTGVCSTGKVEMVRAMGADQVVDYTKEDFTQNGERYDLILAANGNRMVTEFFRALNPNGICVVTGGSMAQIFSAMFMGPLMSMSGKRKIGNMTSHPNQQDLVFLKELLEDGKIAPVIDRCYPLDAVADAIRYVEAGHASGKVVITMQGNDSERRAE